MPVGDYTSCPDPNLRQFIADHAAPYDPAVADYLAQTLPPDPGLVEKLARALKQIRVRKLALADFAPSKRTLERGDVDGVVAEFRQFLLEALDGDEAELTIVELE